MKKILALIILSTTLLTGCRREFDADNIPKRELKSNDFVSDWTSPEGVHYWVIENGGRIGLAPRYNENGNLMIDDKEKE